MERLFKVYVDQQNRTGVGAKCLPHESEMYDVFGSKEDICPSVLLGASGGLKRKQKNEDQICDDDQENFARKKVKYQKAKATFICYDKSMRE